MDWMAQLGGLVEQLSGDKSAQAPGTDEAVNQVLNNAPTSAISGGLADAFRSDQTPAFGQMAAQMFDNANPEQRAGLLNTLINLAGPTVLSQLAQRGGNLGGLLGGGQSQVTPDQAQQISPAEVEDLATVTEKNDPSVVDRISDFYAAHPTLVKTIGTAAIGIIMAKLANRK